MASIDHIAVSVYEVPLDSPESDGTIVWTKTTMVLVELSAGGRAGLGWTYGAAAAAQVIRDVFADRLRGRDAFAIPMLHGELSRALRNIGREGVASTALSAVDVALWDLKAKLLGLPLFSLLGHARGEAPIYGSGGFTSESPRELERQLGGWVSRGIGRVKMKVGREPAADVERVRHARAIVGNATELYVDANGAWTAKEALQFADSFAALGVSYLEEPVSSDDLDALSFVRGRGPAGMAVAAGEYGWDGWYFRRMLEARAVDILQADATRCGGFTGFLAAAQLADAFAVPLSSHCAPSLHLHAACAAPRFAHMEYFADHVRVETMFFDGVIDPIGGALRPDVSRPGLGLELKRKDVERFRKE